MNFDNDYPIMLDDSKYLKFLKKIQDEDLKNAIREGKLQKDDSKKYPSRD